ncbi:MAG TPA: hypothetical protein VMT94_01625 [Burkholderiales bacterium]|nr:hypothetical protein [Burkholderiales bacterium]
MQRLKKIFFISLALFVSVAQAESGVWPKLQNGTDIAQCSEALKIAKAAFQSDNFSLSDNPPIPDDLGSAIIFSLVAI